MKVHIVSPKFINHQMYDVLPRLARVLADGTGWSVGAKPDLNADLNYFLPYLLHDGGFDATTTAAWFTHREESRTKKDCAWTRISKAVDLRTVSTALYAEQLEPTGRTVLVTPPVDPQFVPAHKEKGNNPVVGVAGYTYPSGRKGERLVQRLMNNILAKDIEIRGAGKGWPCPTKEYSWVALPDFYTGLDVLLCTSLAEGPGYPPLEALACGIKVVVPRGVGIFDELPDLPGIHRYERGEFDDMLRALKEALDARADPDALRGTVARFTSDRWIEDHERAFRDLLWPAGSALADLPDWRGNCGIYIVAYGSPARKCAKTAIRSCRAYLPAVPVCLASDKPLGIEDVFVEEPDADMGARSVKTRIYDLAPENWRYVLYLDADTEIVADISFLFDLLAGGWEMFICYNPAQYILGRNMVRGDNEDECEETFNLVGTDEFVQMNGGVFGFRRCARTERFFHDWHREWSRWGKRDQAAFDRALYANPLRLYTLGVEWNTVTRYVSAERSAGVLHRPTLARRWQGIIHARLDSPEAWKEAGLR